MNKKRKKGTTKKSEKKGKKNTLSIIILILLPILLAPMFFGYEMFDSKFMTQTAYFIQGNPVEYDIGRGGPQELTSPIAVRMFVPLLSVPLAPLFGMEIAFAIVGVLFWILGGLATYYFFRKFFEDEKLGLYTAIMFAISMPSIVWGPMVATDMGGYFFLIFGILIIEKYAREYTYKSYSIMGVVLALAILTRDHLLLLLIYLGLTVLFDKGIRIKEYIGDIPKFLIAILIALLPYWLWKKAFNIISGSNWLMSYITQSLGPGGISTFIFRTALTFHYLWVIFFISIVKLYKKLSKYKKEFIIKNSLSIIPYVLFSYIIANYSPRYAFALFPLVLPFATYQMHLWSMSLQKKTKINYRYFMLGFIILYGVISIIGASMYPRENRVNDVGTVLSSIFGEDSWLAKLGV
ncbi:ArnT family glycosyltransferase [Nanoarchaeota archaeon]